MKMVIMQDLPVQCSLNLNMNHAKEKPQVLDYAIYVMNTVNDVAGEAGFAPIPDEEAEQLKSELEELK